MTDATMPERDFDLIAAEYVLRLLSPRQEREVEYRMNTDRRLENSVAEWNNAFALMADEVEDVAAPKAVKGRLMESLFGEPRQATSIWDRLGLWQGASFASLALAAGLGYVLLTQPPADAPVPVSAGTYLVSEIAAEDNSLRVLAVYEPELGTLTLTRTDGAARQGRALELWAIDGDSAPISLGVLPQDEKGRAVLPEALRPRVGELLFAISDEPEGGSPTGAPTGDVLALGGVTEI